MSFQGNGCPNCTEERMCPECYLGMVEFEYESAKRRIIETQKVIGNYQAAMAFWDNECSEALSQVENFHLLILEEEIKNANFTSKTANGS